MIFTLSLSHKICIYVYLLHFCVFYLFLPFLVLYSIILIRPMLVPVAARSKRMSAVVRQLRLWVRIQLGAWMSACCECCVLSDRGLCDELIARPEDSYRLWCVVVCDLETSWMRSPWPTGGCCAKNNNNQTCKEYKSLGTWFWKFF